MGRGRFIIVQVSERRAIIVEMDKFGNFARTTPLELYHAVDCIEKRYFETLYGDKLDEALWKNYRAKPLYFGMIDWPKYVAQITGRPEEVRGDGDSHLRLLAPPDEHKDNHDEA